MRKKLVLIVILLIFAVVFVSMENRKVVFVSSTKKTKLYTDNDIKKVDNIISDLSNKSNNTSLNILKKYSIIDKKDTQFCNKKDNTYLISNENGFDVISYQNGNNFEYYKAKGNKCTLIGVAKDVNFTSSSDETYANDSIYTDFDSLSNFDLSGLIRITKNEEKPYNTVYKRYTNPIAFSKGVLLIENSQNLVAFDKDDKVIFKQNNSKNNRNIIAINRVDKSLFMIVEKDNKVALEGYEMSNTGSIEKAKPKISYDVSSYYKDMKLNSADFSTKKSAYYASFTANGFTMIVEHDFGKIYTLKNADTVLDINGSMVCLKKDELYYVVDLSKNEKEELGNIQALSFKSNGDNLYFTVLDTNSKEVYIRYTTR